jgi:threonine synthase
VSLDEIRARRPDMWRYRELLPVEGPPVSLGEPATPLLALPRLSQRWGAEVYLKDESSLPTGTFKSRGAAVGVTRALELGVTEIVMPSAGNAGAAWSIYCARAGITLTVLMAKTAPDANKAEVLNAGARLELVDGTIADANAKAAEIARETGVFLASTFSEPYRIDGKKTAFLEIFDDLGSDDAMTFPKSIVVPVGGGVAAIALERAAAQARAAGWATGDDPTIVGIQTEDCAPLVRAFESGGDGSEPWPAQPTTIAAGLRVPKPSEGPLVLRTIRENGGTLLAVSEDAIRAAIGDLASSEGVFACPEGAATVAAAAVLAERGELESPVVLYNTGAGIKYLDVLA